MTIFLVASTCSNELRDQFAFFSVAWLNYIQKVMVKGNASSIKG